MQEYDKYLFQRCQNGENVTIDQKCVIVEPEKMCFLPHEEGKPIRIPSAGRWMLIPLRSFKGFLGMANLAEYSLEELKTHAFYLGLYGSVQFRFAHVMGLRRFLLSKDSMTPDQFLLALRSELQPAVSKAVNDALGCRTIDYRKIRDEMLPSISEAVNHTLFAELFPCGVCMHCGSFRIENISRPVMKRP